MAAKQIHENLKNRPQYQFPSQQNRPTKIGKTGHSISFRHSKTDPQKSEKQATVSVSMTAKQTHKNLKNRPQYQFPWQQSSITPDPQKSEKQLQHEFLWQQNSISPDPKISEKQATTSVSVTAKQTHGNLKNRPQQQFPWQQSSVTPDPWNRPQYQFPWQQNNINPDPWNRPQYQFLGQLSSITPDPGKSEKYVTETVSVTAKSPQTHETGHSISAWDTKAASPQTHKNLKNRPQYQFLWWQSSINLDSWKSETQGHSVYSFLWQQSIIGTAILSQFEVLFDWSLIICPALL